MNLTKKQKKIIGASFLGIISIAAVTTVTLLKMGYLTITCEDDYNEE